jgi:hypothetical protein
METTKDIWKIISQTYPTKTTLNVNTASQRADEQKGEKADW